jgi:hypothetical protein
MYRHIQSMRMLRAWKPSVRQPICLAPKLRACAYANTVPCVRQHRLPPLLVTVTSVHITDPFAVVDPTRELPSEWFLSVGLCGSGTDLFYFYFYPYLNSSLYHTDTLLVICYGFYCFTVHYVEWHQLLDLHTRCPLPPLPQFAS